MSVTGSSLVEECAREKCGLKNATPAVKRLRYTSGTVPHSLPDSIIILQGRVSLPRIGSSVGQKDRCLHKGVEANNVQGA